MMSDRKKLSLRNESTIQQPRCIDKVVATVLAIIVFLYSAAVFNVIQPYYGLYSAHGAAQFLFLTATTGLGLAFYLTCVHVNPGQVPADYAFSPTDTTAIEEGHSVNVVQVKRNGKARWCKKCNAAKPPRAHHCRRCGHCVLRMDHHCVWINNCVGHGNYRAFFQMAFYLAVASSHAAALFLMLNVALAQHALGYDVLESSNSSSSSSAGFIRQWNLKRGVVEFVATIISVPLSLSLITLLVWNCKLLSENKTTIEHHEGVAAKLSAPAAAQGAGVHPWDLGDWHDNVEDVFGGVEKMVWPCGGVGGVGGGSAAEGNGVVFKTRWDGSK